MPKRDHRVTALHAGPVMTPEFVAARCLTAASARSLSSDSQCQTAMRNPPRPWVGATVAVVLPPWQAGHSPRQGEGRSAEVALPSVCARLGGRARPLAKGTLRPSALRAAVYGLPGSVSRIDGRLLHFRSITGPSSGNRTIGWGHSAPGRSRRRPGRRACEARVRGRRTPLRLQTPLEAPSNERGCRTITIGT